LIKSFKKLLIARLSAGGASCTQTRQRNVLTACLGGNAAELLNAAPNKRFHRFIKN